MRAGLRDRVTRQPKWNALVGWQSYYRSSLEATPASALIDHRGPYLGGEARHAQMIDAIAAGRRAFLISAPAGCGKSRFALELARRLERAQRSWDVRFVRHDEATLDEELQDLPKAGRRILIVDDAEDCSALVEQLASICFAQGESQTHLVCLARPEGRAPLIEALASQLTVAEPVEMDLGRPDPKDIRALINALIPQLSPHHRDVIRRSVADSFFAAVLLCASVARQKKLPQTLSTKNLRDYAVRQPIAQAIADLCPPDKAFRALAAYAACAPVRAGDAAIRASAATLAALAISDVEALEQLVLKAGLFEVEGRDLIRPLPALGELILEETCRDEQGRPTSFGKALIRTHLEEGRYQPVIANCGDGGRLFSSPERVDFLSELLLERANELSVENRAAAEEMLDGCTGLAVRQPGVIVRLIDALTARGVLGRHADNPEVGAQRLLLSAGEHDPTIVPRALEYSRQLLRRVRPDEEVYRALRDRLTEFCQFAVGRPLGHVTAVLDVLKTWSEDSETRSAELAASLVRGFLRLEMPIRHRGPDAPPGVSIGLISTDDICKLRDHALAILARCALHGDPSVEYAAASSLSDWALGYPNLISEAQQRWEPQLGRELDLLVATFGKLGSTTSHLPVRAAVEQQGWRWWMDGPEVFIRRGGTRILEVVPEAATYSLWKALHAATLPIFPPPLDETIEPRQRRDHLLPVMEPSAARAGEQARELFDRLDLLCHGSSSWLALFASAVGELPPQPLHPQVRVYLQEFIGRHPDETWSLVSEEVANGPLGALLPMLLTELRGRDAQRWHQAIQGAVPGTRLFEMELRALCATGELDPVERAMVSKGLELDTAEIVHLSARALLSAPHSALGPGLSAVFASLPRHSADARLWELTLDAFARWGDYLLKSPAGEEADPARATSGELLRLLRTTGGALPWDQGPHTRRLGNVLAILAVAVPHTLKTWMRQEGVPAADPSATASLLSPARVVEAVRLLAKSSAASFWQKQFIEWLAEEPDLADIAAAGLAELSGQGDRNAALEAIDRAMQSTDLPEPLRQTLAQARQAIQAAVEDDILRGEAR